MAKALKQTLTDIAKAIRAKDGTSTLMTSQEMPARIAAIPSGGGGGPKTLAEIYPLSFSYAQFTQEELDKILKGGGDELPAVSLEQYFYQGAGYTKLPNLPTKNVTNFARCFYSNDVQTIESLDTSSAKNMESMFRFSGLIQVPKNFSLLSATNCIGTFGFTKIKSFPTMYMGNVTTAVSMFGNCDQLTSVGSCDVSSVTKFDDGIESWREHIFSSCPKLTHIGFYNIKASINIDQTAVIGVELKSFLNQLANHDGAKATLGLNSKQFGSLTSADFNALTAKNWEAAQITV